VQPTSFHPIRTVMESVSEGRSPLVLTERNEHLARIERGLADRVIARDEPRVILATGKYVGEGFDDPRVDTLFLTAGLMAGNRRAVCGVCIDSTTGSAITQGACVGSSGTASTRRAPS